MALVATIAPMTNGHNNAIAVAFAHAAPSHRRNAEKRRKSHRTMPVSNNKPAEVSHQRKSHAKSQRIVPHRRRRSRTTSAK